MDEPGLRDAATLPGPPMETPVTSTLTGTIS